MILRLTSMQTDSKGLHRVPRLYHEQLKRSCRCQLKGLIMATGTLEEDARKAICRLVREDQLQSHLAWANLPEYKIPARAIVLNLERLCDDLEKVGIFPEDFDDHWMFHGRFFLDGTSVPKGR